MPWLCCVLAAVQSRAAPQPRRLSQLSSRGRAQALRCRLQQLRLTGCAAQAEWLRHTGLACGVLPDEGRSPVSPALLGGFLTTTLAGKPPRRVLLTGLCSLGMLLCLLPDQDKVLAVRWRLKGWMTLSRATTRGSDVSSSPCAYKHRHPTLWAYSLFTWCFWFFSFQAHKISFPSWENNNRNIMYKQWVSV